MPTKSHVLWLIAFIACLAGSVSSGFAAVMPNPKERIDYWRNNYKELAREQDPRVTKVFEIFDRVLRVAGTPRGTYPRLHILAEDPLNMSLPISIPDGWIIFSKRVIDLCYQNGKHGDAKLAFIMAHEIAHILDDDFWHMEFFDAVEHLKQGGKENTTTLNEIVNIVNQTDKIAAKELRADEKGILIAAMSGFDVNAIVGENDSHSFFDE